MSQLPIQSPELLVACEAAKAGGAIVRDHFQSGVTAKIKTAAGQSQGLVTVADVESEAAIVATIKGAFPDHAVLAEESNEADRSNPNLWIVDPLDGTNNFGHGIPHFAVSVAYYKNGRAKCGVVYDPIRNDWFVAEQGRGAWKNSERVRVNSHQQLDETMVAVGFYYDRGEVMRATLRSIENCFEMQVQGVRRMGTAALDLIHVGIGSFGGFFEYTLSPWDFAAAALFVEEAGGTVTNCLGEALPIEKSSILATNQTLHPVLLEIVRKHHPVF